MKNMEMPIIFSTDGNPISLEDNFKTGELAEEFFEMEGNPDQIPATKENVIWINRNLPYCINAIKSNGKLIGFTFILPATNFLMEEFISNKITENELFERIKVEVNLQNFEAIYLCSAVIHPEFRRQGLAKKGFVKSILKICEKKKLKPKLFCWNYTSEGKNLAVSVAEELGLELHMKE